MENIIRLILGSIFCFSGFVKGLEYNVTTLVVSNYFELFNIYVPSWISIIFSTGLIATEIIVGVCIIFKVYENKVKWICLAICLFFLVLTYVVAKKGGLDNCGCFGRVVEFDAWESFYKNVLLSVVSAIYCIKTRESILVLENGKCLLLILLWIVPFSISIIIFPDSVDKSAYSVNTSLRHFEKEKPIFYIDYPSDFNCDDEFQKRITAINNGEYLGESALFFCKGFDDSKIRSLVQLGAEFGKDNNDSSPIILTTSGTDDNYPLIFPISYDLYNSMFSGDYGVLILKDSTIVKKIDMNPFSLYIMDTFHINVNLYDSIGNMIIIIWIVSFLCLLLTIFYISNKGELKKVVSVGINSKLKIKGTIFI